MTDNEAGNSPQEAQAVSAVQSSNWAAAAELALLEQQAVAAATAQQRSMLAQVFRQTAAQYVLMFGGTDAPADPARSGVLLDPIVQTLVQVATLDYATPLQHYADLALARGVAYGNRYLAQPVAIQSVTASPQVADAIGGVAQSVADVADRVTAGYEQLEIADFSGLQRAMSRAAQVANPVKQAAAWSTVRANSDGLHEVAARTGGRLLWVAERDACVVCLALSGRLSDPSTGEAFDEEATFGKPGSAMSVWPIGMPLTRPPRHPFCRCHLEIWFGVSTGEGGPHDDALYNRPDIAAGVDLPAALRREAKRSVLRGWSLPTESHKVRLDAADRLLQRGAGMPTSVEDRARRAIRNRRFPDRNVPGTRRPR